MKWSSKPNPQHHDPKGNESHWRHERPTGDQAERLPARPGPKSAVEAVIRANQSSHAISLPLLDRAYALIQH